MVDLSNLLPLDDLCGWSDGVQSVQGSLEACGLDDDEVCVSMAQGVEETITIHVLTSSWLIKDGDGLIADPACFRVFHVELI